MRMSRYEFVLRIYYGNKLLVFYTRSFNVEFAAGIGVLSHSFWSDTVAFNKIVLRFYLRIILPTGSETTSPIIADSVTPSAFKASSRSSATLLSTPIKRPPEVCGSKRMSTSRVSMCGEAKPPFMAVLTIPVPMGLAHHPWHRYRSMHW
jgi:hypothetical protein